jgi:hypothetical protein
MKQKILDALKAKFTGVSDNILNRIAEKLAKTVTKEDDVQAAVDAVTLQQVIDGEADRRATDATQTAVTNYEKKHSLKEGKPVEGGGEGKSKQQPEGGAGQQNQQPNNDTPEWAKAILETNKKLEERLARIEGEKTTTSRKTTLNKVLEGAPEKIRLRYEKDFVRMDFKDDEDFNGWISEITPDMEAIVTDFSAKGGVVNRPKGGAGTGDKGDKVSPILQARIKEKEAETSAPAIVGLQNETTK